eukprot:TRINITY_DN65769_c0_g1_i1.p1 TRINITY_DN65769_c0_g1~~TRINITY_DN65769_c0_g1_i1.p1  ORF type:complete len:266 (-),score=39.88 TRINITY_DN65769_c0_g1_i1:244-1041(-)
MTREDMSADSSADDTPRSCQAVQARSLPEACLQGDETYVAVWLKSQYGKPSFRLQPAEKSPLHAAAMHGRVSCLAMLLESGIFAVDELDQSGSTALAYACEFGHLKAVQILSAYGARRSHVCMGGCFAFEAAAAHACIVEWLAVSRDWSTPLHHASVLPVGHVRHLLRSGASIHKRKRNVSRRCASPLELAAVAETSQESCRLILLAAQPWSASTHELFPRAARTRAKKLLCIGRSLADIHDQRLFDVWCFLVMPFAIERDGEKI